MRACVGGFTDLNYFTLLYFYSPEEQTVDSRKLFIYEARNHKANKRYYDKMDSTMQQRRDEILQKKAKLAELKRQRELRKQETANRQSLNGSPLHDVRSSRLNAHVQAPLTTPDPLTNTTPRRRHRQAHRRQQPRQQPHWGQQTGIYTARLTTRCRTTHATDIHRQRRAAQQRQ